MLGLSLPPFDMIWLIETIGDYVENVRREETQQNINNKIKENRLLYELGEITKDQYEKRNKELNQQRRINNQINRMNLNQRINILG
jgi:2-methylisocitrate lyase-like PEP mutase family enzyme